MIHLQTKTYSCEFYVSLEKPCTSHLAESVTKIIIIFLFACHKYRQILVALSCMDQESTYVVVYK